MSSYIFSHKPSENEYSKVLLYFTRSEVSCQLYGSAGRCRVFAEFSAGITYERISDFLVKCRQEHPAFPQEQQAITAGNAQGN